MDDVQSLEVPSRGAYNVTTIGRDYISTRRLGKQLETFRTVISH